MIFKAILVIAVILSACSLTRKLEGDGTISYTVKAGDHYSVRRYTKLNSPAIAGDVEINETWKWDPEGRNGWSKVIGVGNLQNFEKENVRLVYQTKMIEGKIAGIFGIYVCDDGYCYNKNTNKETVIDTIWSFDKRTFEFNVGYKGNDKAYLNFNGKYREKNVTNIHGIKYLSHPYIGGTYTIDHDWNVKLYIKSY